MSDLERVCGGPVELIRFRDTVQDVEALRPLVEKAEVIAAVLPLPKLAELIKLTGDKPLICAVSGRAPVNAPSDGEPEFAFVHLYWERIARLELEVVRL